jgi:hypothetical protein
MDEDDSGCIDFPEFLAFIAKKQRQAAVDPVTFSRPCYRTQSYEFQIYNYNGSVVEG